MVWQPQIGALHHFSPSRTFSQLLHLQSLNAPIFLLTDRNGTLVNDANDIRTTVHGSTLGCLARHPIGLGAAIFHPRVRAHVAFSTGNLFSYGAGFAPPALNSLCCHPQALRPRHTMLLHQEVATTTSSSVAPHPTPQAEAEANIGCLRGLIKDNVRPCYKTFILFVSFQC